MKYCRIVYSGKPYLAHHGIDGQKWGVRNGPPYPLDRETHIKVVREGYVKNRDLGPKSRYKKMGLVQFSDATDRQWKEVIKDTSGNYVNYASYLAKNPESHRHYTKWDSWDRLAKEAIQAYGTEKWTAPGFGENGESAKDFYGIQKDIFGKVKATLDDHQILEELKKTLSNADERAIRTIVDTTNPDYGDEGTTHNCMKCTAAAALSMMGYDGVEAGRSVSGASSGGMTYWFNGATEYKEKGTESAGSRIDKILGNNGYGALAMAYPGNSGHSMMLKRSGNKTYLMENQGAKLYTYDNTKQSMSDILDDVADKYGFDKKQFVSFTRLDTATPNWEHLAEDSVIRNSRWESDSLIQRKTDDKMVRDYQDAQIVTLAYPQDSDPVIPEVSWDSNPFNALVKNVNKEDALDYVKKLKERLIGKD